jgi:phospholipid/cholesterol/gamma-HCH transport system substrate-binding protein
MERNAHYAAVGLATLVLILGTLLFCVWLARFQFARNYDVYDVVFTGPVRGLSKGGEVHFNGIKVGEVTDLKLDAVNANRVIATVRMTSQVPVKPDSRAQLEPQGITGVSYIQITAGRPKAPLLKTLPHPNSLYPEIQSQQSPLNELIDSSSTVVAKALETLDRANRVLSDDNLKALAHTMKNIEAITEEVKDRKAVLDEAQTAIQNAGEAARQVSELARSTRGLIEGDGARAIHNAAQATADIDVAAKDVHALMARLQGPTSEFASQGLPELTAAAVSLQQTSDALRRLIDEASRSPQGLIGKAPSKEIEVKP